MAAWRSGSHVSMVGCIPVRMGIAALLAEVEEVLGRSRETSLAADSDTELAGSSSRPRMQRRDVLASATLEIGERALAGTPVRAYVMAGYGTGQSAEVRRPRRPRCAWALVADTTAPILGASSLGVPSVTLDELWSTWPEPRQLVPLLSGMLLTLGPTCCQGRTVTYASSLSCSCEPRRRHRPRPAVSARSVAGPDALTESHTCRRVRLTWDKHTARAVECRRGQLSYYGNLSRAEVVPVDVLSVDRVAASRERPGRQAEVRTHEMSGGVEPEVGFWSHGSRPPAESPWRLRGSERVARRGIYPVMERACTSQR